MGDYTTNISSYELECPCGKCDVTIQPHEPVIQVVQLACDFFAKRNNVKRVVLDITSSARCYEYNRIPSSKGGPGSNDNSQHPRANAIDHRIVGVQIVDLADYYRATYPNKYGIGQYNTFVHIDTRETKARWRMG